MYAAQETPPDANAIDLEDVESENGPGDDFEDDDDEDYGLEDDDDDETE